MGYGRKKDFEMDRIRRKGRDSKKPISQKKSIRIALVR